MSGFAHFARDAIELEREILKRGILLGIDWNDAPAVRQLAREALAGGASHTDELAHRADIRERARGELFALSVLMLRVMQESAAIGVHTHGGPVWKAFGRALIEEQAQRAAGPLQGSGDSSA